MRQRHFFLLVPLIGTLVAQPSIPEEVPAEPDTEAVETEDVSGTIPEEPEPTPLPAPFVPEPHLQGTLEALPPDERSLFQQGHDPGHVGDNPQATHRRLVQRTIMPTELPPRYGAVLTFDDQLVPFVPKEESAAIEVAKDLQAHSARAIFFANVPGVSAHDVRRILRQHSTRKTRLKACDDLLASKRAVFVTAIRELLALKNPPPAVPPGEFAAPPPPPLYTCEVYNHTAFHQDMRTLQAGSDRLALCLRGIEFIESCLDEAYAAERPDFERARWFRFPFLHEPRKKAVRQEVIHLFNTLGLLSLGETQDSKDVKNLSPDKAYASLVAAQKNKRYNPKFGGTYSAAERPIALFHTKTWKKIRPGVLRVLKKSE